MPWGKGRDINSKQEPRNILLPTPCHPKWHCTHYAACQQKAQLRGIHALLIDAQLGGQEEREQQLVFLKQGSARAHSTVSVERTNWHMQAHLLEGLQHQ